MMGSQTLFFWYEVDSSAIKSSGVYLLDCGEVLPQLRRGEGRLLGNGLLSISQRVHFYSSTFCEVLKTPNHFSQKICRRSNGDVINAGLARGFIKVETAGGNSLPVLYKKDTMGILRNQLLLACNEDVTFRRRHNGRGAA